MFSRTVDYALRATCYLGQRAPEALTTVEIAANTNVPLAYLSKVIQSLSKAGIVKTQRGVGGGIRLIDSPEDLTLLRVVNAVEPISRIRTCPVGANGAARGLCSLHRHMDEAMQMIEDRFRNTTMADVIAESESDSPLCDVMTQVESVDAEQFERPELVESHPSS